MKPSDFQKTVQCRFESCLKKVVRSVVKDYYKELNRRKNKEISFSELPDVLVCIFRKNCASVPEERSAIPLQTEQSSAG